MARYTLFEQGPNNDSMWAECFGPNPAWGRERASADTLVGLMDAVDELGHDNFGIRGPGQRNVARSRREYYALPTVAKELARIEREERGGR